jgi:hypothetical protein
MQSVAGIGGKCRVRRRQAFEAVGGKDAATRLAIGVEDAAHVDTRAAAPHAGLDKVAWYLVENGFFAEMPQISHAHSTDHCLRQRRPIVP